MAGADTGATMPDGATIRAVKDASWAKNPKSIPRRGMLTFENFSSSGPLRRHREAQARQDRRRTSATGSTRRWRAGNGPPPVNFGASFDSGVLGAGETVATNYRLSRGNYVLVCFWRDSDMGGMPHAFMGMYRGIKVK